MTAARWKFLLMAAIFFSPLFGAYLLYFGPDSWKPTSRTEFGELITPARPLPEALAWQQFGGGEAVADPLRGQWTLLHVLPAECGEDCRKRLWETRQLRTSLHRHRERVRRVAWHPRPQSAELLAGELSQDHPLLRHVALPAAADAELRAEFGAVAEAEGVVLLVDPLGNWLMVYRQDVPLRGMYKDIKKLLKLSQIG